MHQVERPKAERRRALALLEQQSNLGALTLAGLAVLCGIEAHLTLAAVTPRCIETLSVLTQVHIVRTLVHIWRESGTRLTGCPPEDGSFPQLSQKTPTSSFPPLCGRLGGGGCSTSHSPDPPQAPAEEKGGSLLEVSEQAVGPGRLQWHVGDMRFGEPRTQPARAEPGWCLRACDSMSQQDAQATFLLPAEPRGLT